MRYHYTMTICAKSITRKATRKRMAPCNADVAQEK